jgi:hypothetical protein
MPANLIATGPRRSSPAVLSESGSPGGGPSGKNRLKAEDATNLAERLAVASGEEEDDAGAMQGSAADGGGGSSSPAMNPQAPSPRVENPTQPADEQQNPMPAVPTEANAEEGEDPFREIEQDPALYKAVVLRMALQRQAFDEPRLRDFTVSPEIGM